LASLIEKKELLEITPEIASQYLTSNFRNRPLRQYWAHELSLRMKEGSFETRREGLIVNSKGELVNGQHRLSAIVESGCTVKMWVATKAD